MQNKKIIIANWKMNPDSFREAEELFNGVKKQANKLKKTKVIICPPCVFINKLKQLNKKNIISLGTQDCFRQDKGAWTGMISAKMLKNAGADFVIVGHSERRGLGDNDQIVNQKIKLALKNKLNAILCIGETDRDEDGKFFSFLENQLLSALSDIGKKFVKNILIAYEPIWAISAASKKVITVDELQQISIFIRKILMDKYGAKSFEAVKVLYGGSVDFRNAEELICGGGVDGFLVGRKSLVAERFNKILEIVEKI
ncbi:MAG: triose-phosphate isomerase [Patescibacteria group bacterium]